VCFACLSPSHANHSCCLFSIDIVRKLLQSDVQCSPYLFCLNNCSLFSYSSCSNFPHSLATAIRSDFAFAIIVRNESVLNRFISVTTQVCARTAVIIRCHLVGLVLPQSSGTATAFGLPLLRLYADRVTAEWSAAEWYTQCHSSTNSSPIDKPNAECILFSYERIGSMHNVTFPRIK